jgi:hypothetical protein
MYLHELGNEVDSFTKEDMAQGKHLLSNITLNPEEPSLNQSTKQLQQPPPPSVPITTSQPSTPRREHVRPSRPAKQQQNGAWKTVVEPVPQTSTVHPPSSSLNPDDWPDALSVNNADQPRKRRVPTPQQQPRTVVEPPVNENSEHSQPKSALPASASWASKPSNEIPEDDKITRNKKNGAAATPMSTSSRNVKVQPAQVLVQSEVRSAKAPNPTKKPEWRKTASAPTQDTELDSSDSDSDQYKSRQSNETEHDYEDEDEFDDGIDNATYDERMSRLSLNEIHDRVSSDSRSEDNDNEENTPPEPPVIDNNAHVSEQIKKKQQFSQQTTFDPDDLQGFADWLRLRFTDLLLDNFNDYNIPLNFSTAPLPLLWTTPFVFLGNSPTTKSRFDFARQEDPPEIIPSRTPQTNPTPADIVTPIPTQHMRTSLVHTHTPHIHTTHPHPHTQPQFKVR